MHVLVNSSAHFVSPLVKFKALACVVHVLHVVCSGSVSLFINVVSGFPFMTCCSSDVRMLLQSFVDGRLSFSNFFRKFHVDCPTASTIVHIIGCVFCNVRIVVVVSCRIPGRISFLPSISVHRSASSSANFVGAVDFIFDSV